MIELPPVGTDPGILREAFGCFPSGVTAVCGLMDGTPVGMAASSFTSVSVSPPLVSVCVQDTSETWPRLKACPRLGLSVLAEDHDAACLSLSSKKGDRFAEVEWDATSEGSVFVAGASLWLDCSLYDEVAAGDHGIAILAINNLHAVPDRAPLVFHGSKFRRLAAL